MNEEKNNKLFTIHDRIEELIGELSEKLCQAFPEHWEALEKQILVEGKDVVKDAEIMKIVSEIRELENMVAEDNMWVNLLNPETRK